MDNNNTFDWLAVQAQSPDKTFADLYSTGVDPNNTRLQSKDFYKSKPKIQEKFKTATGEFDNASFDSFYSDAQKSLNLYKKGDFSLGNVTTDLWDDTSTARALKAPIRKNPVKLSLASNDPFTNLKVAQQSFMGLTDINKWSKPIKTLSEVAQTQKVIDGTTGKELDYTPEDNGITDLFGFAREPLVLAQYDEDEKDEKGNVVHTKGETKFDENGLPRYETLAGRSIAGRQQLSAWDTLFREDSYINRFNFMEGDDMQKSTTGTIVKAAVELAPFLVGGNVAAAYKAYYIASNLLDGALEIGKAVDGILTNDKNGNFYKFANQLQGYIGQAKTSTSEYGRENFFSLENIANQAVDSVFQLMSQRAIAQWPSELKKYQMAKELGIQEGTMLGALSMSEKGGAALTEKLLNGETYLAKYGKDWGAAVQALANNANQLEKYQKYSSYFSTAYMAATSAVGISQVAEEAGLDSRDKGMLYLGYAAALAPLFRSEVGQWVERGIGIDDLAVDMNRSVREYARGFLPSIRNEVTEVIEDNTIKGRGLNLIAQGKKLGKFIADKYKNFHVHDTITAGIAEGTEEVTEQLLQDALMGVYNGLNSYGLTSTQEGRQFDMNTEDLIKDLGANAFGGFLGGTIFKNIERHMNPDLHGTPQSKEMMKYVTEGHGDRIVKIVDQLREKGQLGDTGLSLEALKDVSGNKLEGMWQPVTENNEMSQNDSIADRITKIVRTTEALRKGFGIDLPETTMESKNKFYQALVDTKTDTDLRDRIHDVAGKMYTLFNEMQSLSNLEAEESAEAMSEKKVEMKLLQNELEYLQSDKSVDEFFRQGLFNIRTDINNTFGVKNRDYFAQQVNPDAVKYSDLTAAEKKEAKELQDSYKLDEGPEGMKSDLYKARMQYERFNTTMERRGHYKELEVFKQSIEQLKQYANFGKLIQPDGYGNAIAELQDYQLMDDYLNKITTVKYMPDYIYDMVKKNLSTFASKHSTGMLALMSPDLESFKKDVNKNLKSLPVMINQPAVKKYLEKRFGGKKFEEFVNSPELKDLTENKNNAADYSLLRTLKMIGNTGGDPSLVEYKDAKDILDNLTEEDAQTILSTRRVTAALEPLFNFFQKNKFEDFMGAFVDGSLYGDLDMVYDAVSAKEFLTNFMRLSHLDALGDANGMLLTLEKYVANDMILGLLLDGEYKGPIDTIHLESIQNADTTQLDTVVERSKNFDQIRVASPINDVLKDTYEFINSEYESFDIVGFENYVNNSPEFIEAFDGHLDAIKRIKALIEVSKSMNPIVNDFRKNNGSTLDDVKNIDGTETSLQDIHLFEISNEDASYLEDELSRLTYRVQFLKDVNDFNRNNILNKLLKEDGIDLASKYQSLKDIAADPEVLEKLPSLGRLFQLANVMEYTNDVGKGSNDLKREALYEMVKFEDAIYEDFKKLSKEDKQLVINKTFKPIKSYKQEFFAEADAKKPYNNSLRTIYLAKVYGSSSTEFYTKYAGEFDDATKLYSNIERLPHIPFPSQESAVRLSHLFSQGDKFVIQNLHNAYTKQPGEDSYDFSKSSVKTLNAHSTQLVWGGPGTGKTTAFLTNAVNQVEVAEKNVLLLAPKREQVNKLIKTLTDSGFETSVDVDNSNLVRDFLQSLGLSSKDSKFNFTENDKLINQLTGTSGVAISEDFLSKVDNVFNKFEIYKDKASELDYNLKDDLMAALGKYRVIAIDEYTHINPFDAAILMKLADKYNNSNEVKNNPAKRLTVFMLGDPTQSGYVNADGYRRDIHSLTNLVISQPFSTPLRSGYDLINNVAIDVARRTLKYNLMDETTLANTDTVREAKEKVLKLTYLEDPNGALGNIGIKFVKKEGETNTSDLKFITDNKKHITGKDIVYVVQDEGQVAKAEALLKDALGENWRNFADVFLPTEVQGAEYKYAIIDAMPNQVDNPGYNLRRVHEFLNTMLTRSTYATLLLANERINQFVTLENVKKDKAIEQVKITKDVSLKVKAEKQAFLARVLQDAAVEGEEEVPTEEGEPTTTPATPPAPTGTTTVKPAPKADKDVTTLPVTSIEALNPIFEEPDYSPMVEETSKAAAKNVVSYNSFSTVEDYDSVFKLMYPTAMATELEGKSKNVSSLINSYKYYILHRDRLGDKNISLRNNFISYFQDDYQNNIYDWENPSFYVEIGERGTRNQMVGRNQFGSTYNEKPDQLLSLLKVKLAHVSDPSKDLVLTMGLMNDVASITLKEVDSKDKQGARVVDFFKSVKDAIKGKTTPKIEFGNYVDDGQSKTWRSKEFDADQLERYSILFGSRMMPIEGSQRMTYEELVENYPDFAITQPQAVVARMIEDSNEATLNTYGTNKVYKNKWKALKGKSIVFVSDVYEMPANDPQKMLDIYLKQLDYFNSDKGLEGVPFRQLSMEAKERYIENIGKNLGDYITGRNGVRIEYRPRLVQMVKIDNPLNGFLDFRERFLQAIKRGGKNEFGTALTPAKLEQFNTSIYVKDRLIKSLRVISQFLSDSEENRKWFVKNVLKVQNNDAQARLDALYDDMRKEMGDQFIETAEFSDATLKDMGTLTLEQFMVQLETLFDKDTGIIRGKFGTTKDDNSVRDKSASSDEVTKKDLVLKLTNDKQKDFGGNLIDIRMFNLLKQTRNLNFAELIDLSLKAFSEFNGKFAKYNLNDVFNGGRIEGIVLAEKQEGIDYSSNPLAPVRTHPKGFRVGVLPTHPSYNFDFNFFIEDQSGVPTGKPRTPATPTPTVSEQITDTDSAAELPVTENEKLKELKNKLSFLSKTDKFDEIFSKATTDEEALALLKSEILTPTSYTSPIQTGTVVYYEMGEDNQVTATSLGEDIRDNLNIADGVQSTYELVSNSNTHATYRVTADGNVFEVDYRLPEATLKVTPIAINTETTNPMEVLKKIEGDEMKNYKTFVEEKFGDKAKDKSVKGFLEVYEQLFRHTMLTANIATLKAQSGLSIDLAEYDPELEDFDADTLYSKAGNLQVKNMMAWRTLGVNSAIDALLSHTDNYKPNYC